MPVAVMDLSDESKEAIRQIEKEIQDADTPMEEGRHSDRPKVPIEINASVRSWIRYFTQKDHERFQRFLDRGALYKPTVEKILQEHHIPKEIYYLGMIESGYVVHARSRASAVGPWQMMKGTGRHYGLTTNRYVDERRDVIRATEAAAVYLKALNTAFQSWYLAMAAYNAGEGRILRAILKGKSHDYWTLVEKHALPRETRQYVPKFLAALIIGRNPKKFGFTVPDVEPREKLVGVDVPGSVRLRDIAKASGVSAQTLKDANPQLIRGITPPHRSQYALWVPESQADQVRKISDELASHKLSRRASRRLASSSSHRGRKGAVSYHRVRRGETLSEIAERYRTSIRTLKRLNGLHSGRLLAGVRLRVPVRKIGRRSYHRVRRGEALSSISRRYGVSISSIKQVNDLDSNRIYAGQRLVIPRGI